MRAPPRVRRSWQTLKERGLDPTSAGDMRAALMRRWYEHNRESWWERHKPGIFGAGPDRSGVHADEWMLRMMGEFGRIANLSDAQLCRESE